MLCIYYHTLLVMSLSYSLVFAFEPNIKQKYIHLLVEKTIKSIVLYSLSCEALVKSETILFQRIMNIIILHHKWKVICYKSRVFSACAFYENVDQQQDNVNELCSCVTQYNSFLADLSPNASIDHKMQKLKIGPLQGTFFYNKY